VTAGRLYGTLMAHRSTNWLQMKRRARHRRTVPPRMYLSTPISATFNTSIKFHEKMRFRRLAQIGVTLIFFSNNIDECVRSPCSLHSRTFYDAVNVHSKCALPSLLARKLDNRSSGHVRRIWGALGSDGQHRLAGLERVRQTGSYAALNECQDLYPGSGL
jgi:hypothetical protein